ncbi:uncharacterized protein LOC141685573 [Apium graveolens]|uniref:uncharacterized protein LOC141685573 n=1 Tax=Apium graveolens TaxID=4045 RepID=UPI003D7937BA
MGKNGGPPPKVIEGDDDGEESKQRCYVSIREYYAYKLMIRLTEGLTPHLSGRLWQQYIVDAFTAVEQYRLEWIKRNQKTIRSDLYNSIRDSLRKGDSDTKCQGKNIILPATFTSSQRYMSRYFKDSLFICRSIGHLSFFLTMTCNTKWPEIQNMLQHMWGVNVADAPDVVARVFKMKLDQLLCIKHGSDIAELIKNTSLVIWDEAPMQHRHAFESVDRCFRDLMASVHPINKNILFGGKTVVFGGCGMNAEENQKITEFGKWVLDVGNGKVQNIHPDNIYKDPKIIILRKYLVEKKTNAVKDIVDVTYPYFMKKYIIESYLKERAILTPTNAIVDEVNSHVLNLIPGITHSYLSQDSIDTETRNNDNDYESSFPIEYLNSIYMPSIPKHDLKLKVGVVVMLMRNFNQTMGLRNGT